MTAVLHPALPAVAAWGLVDQDAPLVVDDPAEARALVDAAGEHRLVGVLAVAAGAGAVELPDPVAEDLHRRHHDALVWAMTLEIELLAVVDRLEGAGIEPVVLKGPALAHLDAPDPALRTFADLDLLVPADQLPDAVAMLVADGAIRRVAERRPGWDRRFAKSVTLQRPDGLELDLHRTLVDGAHGGRIPTRDLHRDRAGFELAGRSLWALAPVHRALHSALHLVLGSPAPRLGSVRDLAQVVVDASVPSGALVEEAERWRAGAVLAAALDEVQRLAVDLPPELQVARTRRLPGRERRLVAAARREGSGLGRAKVAAWRELPRWSDRAAYGWAVVAPTRAHLDSRGRRRRQLVVRR